MKAKRFDRHADMNPETVDEIMEIINNADERIPFLIRNSLYGLFDGFLYPDLLPDAKQELSPELAERIENVVNKIQDYPTLK